MPYFNVHIDTCEMLDELSDQQLIDELDKRYRRSGVYKTPIEKREMAFRLREAALEMRKINKLSNAVWLEDIASEMEWEKTK